ncbi:MAG TPA: 4a-hydroxytetrahydrobiopterin dehydratase [Thermomicrobiales bacterium]|nr:4a-hydroxytetrahydrobiopterin dehydratase [Thermomicrobiales bacterium]
MDLASRHCEACRPGAPAVPEDEIPRLLEEIPEWELFEREGGPRLRRTFTFPDFASALAFTNGVGNLAEAEDHHPTLLLRWGKVTVTWWTHAIRGLHQNDFIMAAKTDRLYERREDGETEKTAR